MALIKPKFNQLAFFKSVMKQLDIIETDADGWFDWSGVLGQFAEMADGVIVGEGVGEAKAKIQKIIDELEAKE